MTSRLAAVALPQEIDPAVVTAVTGVFGDIQTFVVATIAGLLFALILAVIGIKVGAKWMNKAAKSV